MMHWRRPDKKATCGLRVAIVGGGFSGTAVLANLVETSKPGTMIELFEASGEFGPGAAYGTQETAHLLNVQAARMGALAADHFVEWLRTDEGAAAAVGICPDREVSPTAYLPRALYGVYLKDVLQHALRTAMRRGIGVSLTHGRVSDVRRQSAALELALEQDGSRRRFDVLVLATGNNPPRDPEFLTARDLRSSRYIGNVWASKFPLKLDRLGKSSTVVILGTGLTAVDAVLSLDARGFKGRIIAVSRHGRLPNVHAKERPPAWAWSVDPDSIEPTALNYLRWLNCEAQRAVAAGADWRGIFEALRPITRRLWRKLEPGEQAKLLRRHSLWSIHRHRMAPEVQAKLKALRVAGRLELVAGRITSARNWFGSFRVRLRRHGLTKEETLRPALILNCTGPEPNVARSSDPLAHKLLDRFLIVRSPNGAGIAVEPDGSARSAAIGSVFAVGPLLMGDIFESTAVPELREQARWVAERIAEINPEHRRTLMLETAL
jgi:uncharacterized NAD(P)/FAD-binding protein YdhS